MPPLALLTYSTLNLGDDIQTVGVANLVGSGLFVDRDQAMDWPAARVVLAGWWLETQSFPPPNGVDALPVAMHWQRGSVPLLEQTAVRRWFHQRTERWNRPIGARDHHTCELFRRYGIPAEVSGCVTLTLPPYHGKRSGIVVIDVPALEAPLKSWGSESGTAIDTDTQIALGWRTSPAAARFAAAVDRLHRVRSAAVVLTSRLHILLPCIAFRTPVIFFPPDHQPERWVDYAHLASFTLPLEAAHEAPEIVRLLEQGVSAPQPVPLYTASLTATIQHAAHEWNLGRHTPRFA